MKSNYDLKRIKLRGEIGSGVLALLSIITFIVSLVYYSTIEYNTTLLAHYTIVTALASIVGLVLITLALYELSRNYNKNSISIFAILGFVSYVLGIVASFMLTYYFGVLSGFEWFISILGLGLLGHGAYLISLNSVGSKSKIELFKYSGYVLFLAALLSPIITIFASIIGFVAWLLCYLAFTKLGEPR